MNYLNSQEIHQFRKKIISLCGEDVSKCIQCGKCTAGCPISPEMDLQPNQVLRFIQINDTLRVLGCATIWLCASCRTCSVRCPEEIDISLIMESLRKVAMDAGQPGVAKVVKFDELFLDSIRQRGRVHEFGLIMRFNLAARTPFKDIHLAPALLAKGKLALFGHRIQEITRIKQIFQESKRFFLR